MVEGLSTRQDSHLTGKPGAGQGSPLRVAPLHRAILSTLLRGVLRHGCRVTETVLFVLLAGEVLCLAGVCVFVYVSSCPE